MDLICIITCRRALLISERLLKEMHVVSINAIDRYVPIDTIWADIELAFAIWMSIVIIDDKTHFYQ